MQYKNEIAKLLCNSYWRMEDCEYGAPAMDCKRPYGNSDVELDILEMLDIVEVGESPTEDQRRWASEAHSNTLAALQIIFKPENQATIARMFDE